MEWILASGSPRRKELLAGLVEKFDIIPSQADEEAEADTPEQLVKLLAEKKASEVAMRTECEGKLVIGSDTVVAYGNEILGKPKDEEDAFRMLSLLSGRAHAVHTGVCFALRKGDKLTLYTRADKTAVYFHRLTPAWIREYIKGGSPMDKAGAYGIQDGGLVEKIEGSYTNVVGFPVELAQEMIEKVKGEWE